MGILLIIGIIKHDAGQSFEQVREQYTVKIYEGIRHATCVFSVTVPSKFLKSASPSHIQN